MTLQFERTEVKKASYVVANMNYESVNLLVLERKSWRGQGLQCGDINISYRGCGLNCEC